MVHFMIVFITFKNLSILKIGMIWDLHLLKDCKFGHKINPVLLQECTNLWAICKMKKMMQHKMNIRRLDKVNHLVNKKFQMIKSNLAKVILSQKMKTFAFNNYKNCKNRYRVNNYHQNRLLMLQSKNNLKDNILRRSQKKGQALEEILVGLIILDNQILQQERTTSK